MISEAKLKHIIGVARKCESLSCIFVPSYLSSNYFMMGYLHDIGYEKNGADAHSSRSYLYCTNFGVEDNNFVEAIKLHGIALSFDKMTLEYAILVYSDLTTNYDGNTISINDRIESIKERYGKNSIQYEIALIQKEELQKFFKIKQYEFKEKEQEIKKNFIF